jgi:hypothetical protein
VSVERYTVITLMSLGRLDGWSRRIWCFWKIESTDFWKNLTYWFQQHRSWLIDHKWKNAWIVG